MLGGGGVSHPSQLTTGLVIKSVTTSPTWQVSVCFYSAGKYSVGTISLFRSMSFLMELDYIFCV